MARLPFIEHISEQISELVVQAPGQGDGLLVALSGGPDSVALLLAAGFWSTRHSRPLLAAHLNHQLRGADADQDEQFCRDLCASLKIELLVERRDPRPLARRRGLGLEEAGRFLRRRFLHDVLQQHTRLACAATGHHLDDQSETIVMRLFRGTGLDGLRGIRPLAGRVIHPLLSVTRSEIIAFLEARGQPYRIDRTNTTSDAVRTRVRRELLPLARDIFGGGVTGNPARLAGLVETDLACLDRLARQSLARIEDQEGLLVEQLCELDRALARRVVRLFMAENSDLDKDLELIHVDALLDWLPRSNSGTCLDLPHGWRAVRNFERLQLANRENDKQPVASAEKYRIVVRSDEKPSGIKNPDSCTTTGPGPDSDTDPEFGPRQIPGGWALTCPAESLSGHLRLRNWRPGDRIEQFGLGGHKKLSDLLQERRINSSDRAGILVIEDETGILWVIGIAQAERTRLLPTSGSTVTISVLKRSSGHNQESEIS